MKSLAIARVNVLRMLRDRSTIFFVFLLPLLLILVLGAMFGGSVTPRVGVVGGEDGPLARDLVARLQQDESIRIFPYDSERVMVRAVERGELEAGLVIPVGYDSLVRSHADLGFVTRDPQQSMAVRSAIDAVVQSQNSVLRAAGFVASSRLTDFDAAIPIAVGQERSTVDVEIAAVGEPFPIAQLGRFDLGAHSQLVLFMFLTSLTGSAALIQVRNLGITRRMLATPTSARQVLAGEALGRWGVAMVQGLFIVLGTWLIFGVDWGDGTGVAVLLVVYAAVGAGAAMLLGAVFRNDAQAGGIGVLLGLGLGALGGCMVPLQIFEVFSPGMYRAAHITPQAWMMEAFIELVQRGGGLGDILPELGVLAGFAAVFFGLAVPLLRRAVTAS